jgi:hypothetical protein
MYCNPAQLLLRNNYLGKDEKREPEPKNMNGGYVKSDLSLSEKNKDLQKVAKKLVLMNSQIKPKKKVKPPNITF